MSEKHNKKGKTEGHHDWKSQSTHVQKFKYQYMSQMQTYVQKLADFR